MKKMAIIAILAITFASCNQKKSVNEVPNNNMEGMTEKAMDTSAETVVKNSETATSKVSPSSSTITEILGNYLKVKNALIKDDSKAAADAGKTLLVAFTNAKSKSMDAKLKNQFNDIADDAKEHAEHIGDNAGKIEHQREHFAMLSKDMKDLIQAFGTSQKLYQDYCPMYDQGKSGYWISETKDIKNPYLGSKMLTCGSIKKEW